MSGPIDNRPGSGPPTPPPPRRLPIDDDVLRRVAAAPPIPEPHLSQIVAIWGSALRVSVRENAARSVHAPVA